MSEPSDVTPQGHGQLARTVSAESAERESSATEELREEQRRLRHALRTPLNQIIGYSEMLQEEASDAGNASLEADLMKIEQAGRKLLDLIETATLLGADPTTSTVSQSPARLLETARAGDPSQVANRHWQDPVRGPASHRHLAAAPTTGRILVVDDEASNRDLLTRRLEARSFATSSAANGAEALSMIARESFDLVLLDVMMPDMSGLMVLRELRKQHEPADLPVIMATARDGSEDMVRALEAGANDYVTKPLDLAVVLARVGTQLMLKSARDRVRELDQRLAVAQERVARMAGPESRGIEDVIAWSEQVTHEIGEAIGHQRVSMFLYERETLVRVAGGAPIPAADEMADVARGLLVARGQQSLVPLQGPSGELFGCLSIASAALVAEAAKRLVINVARQLGAALELRKTRRALAEAAERRRATRQEMLDRGIELLHMCPLCSRCYAHTLMHCEKDQATLVSPPTFPYKVAGRYRLRRKVGEGGMGMVFMAHDERLERHVALKVIRADLFDNEKMRQRFEREARSVASIDHPGVISIFDSGELEDGSLFIVMEWLDGVDLAHVLDHCGAGRPDQVAQLLRETSSALGAAHGLGIVHRDIKPANIFLVRHQDGFRAKLLDFGVAKEMSRDTGLTETGSMVGTPLYMSPEQLLSRTVDVRSDLYSLAVVIFQALTGQRIVEGREFASILLEVVQREAPKLSEILPGVPGHVDESFARAFAKDPGRRPDTVASWVAGFIDELEGLPCHTPGWLIERPISEYPGAPTVREASVVINPGPLNSAGPGDLTVDARSTVIDNPKRR